MRETISIQYLRAIAATMVVVYHSTLRISPTGSTQPYYLDVWGAGVDVFFVVSGFIMWATTNARPVTTIRFFEARLLRIVPLYWASLGLFWLVLALLDGWNSAPALLDVLRSATFVPYRQEGTGFIAPYLIAGWTLTYEIIFYLIFAVALFLETKIARFLFVAMVFVGMMTLRLRWDASNPIIFRLTSPLFVEFLAGMAIAEIVSNGALARFVSRVGFGRLVVGALIVGSALVSSFHALPRIIGLGIPAALAVLIAVTREDAISARPIAWLKHLGDASYSLYLVHEIFLRLVEPVAKNEALPLTFRFLLCFVGSIVFGLLTYTYVEKPLTAAVKSWRNRRRPVAATTGPDVPVEGTIGTEPATGIAGVPGLASNTSVAPQH